MFNHVFVTPRTCYEDKDTVIFCISNKNAEKYGSI